MPRIDVTIFNANADEPGQGDAVIRLTGAQSGGLASAVSASDTQQPQVVDLDGVESQAQAAEVSVLAFNPSVGFVNSANTWGKNMSTALNNMFDPTDYRYLWGRVTNFSQVQIRNIVGGSRATGSADLRAVIDDNPLFYFAFHDTPLHGIDALELLPARVGGYVYKRLNRFPRANVCTFIDQDNAASAVDLMFRTSGAPTRLRVMPAINAPEVYEWWGDHAADMLMGTAFSSNPNNNADDGVDLSDRGWYYTDSTQLVSPNITSKMGRPQNTGTVVSVTFGTINSSPPITNNPGYVTECVINSQPGSGVIGNGITFLNPSGTGFVAYEIAIYQNISGGNARLQMVNPPKNGVTLNQDTVPQAGWPYSISDKDNDTVQGDWDKNGVTDSLVDCSTRFGTGWLSMMDRVSQRTLQVHGRPSGVSGNMVNRSWTEYKDTSAGWPSPHVFTGKIDLCAYENWSSSVFSDTDDDFPGVYRLSSAFTPEYMMSSMGFAFTYINRTPNEFMASKPRGVDFEVDVSGPSSTSAWTNIDHYRAEFLWSVIATTELGLIGFGVGAFNSAVPVAIEHFWLDLDTNNTGYVEIGSWDDAGGAVGSRGPRGAWTWSTGSVGDFVSGSKRIYARRVGDVLIVLNIGDRPGDYGNFYDLDYAVRNPEDIVTASDWASLYSGNMLAGGETLIRPDYTSYINQRLTTYVQAQNPADWAGFDYGPQQDTPWGDLATQGWIIRDPARYGSGQSAINTGVSMNLPLYTSEVFLIQ